MDTYQKVSRRAHAIMDIVNPDTGENVAVEIYRNAAAPEETKPRETPQPQVSDTVNTTTRTEVEVSLCANRSHPPYGGYNSLYFVLRVLFKTQSIESRSQQVQINTERYINFSPFKYFIF